MKKKFTDKQQRFIEEYLVDCNATQAAIRAGYSEDTAYAIGSELLKKLEIKEEIDKLKAAKSEEIGITRERVLKEFADVGFREVKKVTASEKNKALEALGKHLGLFDGDKTEVTVNLGDEIRRAIEREERESRTFAEEKGSDIPE